MVDAFADHRPNSPSEEENQVDRRGLPVPPGEEPAYVLFLKAEGRNTFRRTQGYEFSHRSVGNAEKMTDIYMALTPERLQHYRDLSENDYNSVENRRTRRHAAEIARRNRNAARGDPVPNIRIEGEPRQVVEQHLNGDN